MGARDRGSTGLKKFLTIRELFFCARCLFSLVPYSPYPGISQGRISREHEGFYRAAIEELSEGSCEFLFSGRVDGVEKKIAFGFQSVASSRATVAVLTL